jgi:hypothetical protein
MLVGAALYAEFHPWASENLLPVGDAGKATLVTATGLSPWWFLAALVIAVFLGFGSLERWERRRSPGPA